MVAAYQARATIERCLGALTAQVGVAGLEVVVVDSGNDGTAELVAARFPEVDLCRSAERLDPGAARNLGVERARAELIGFVDADCVAARDWAARVVAAHRAPDPAIGGVVDNGEPGSYLGWAAYLCEFHRWMPGTPGGRVAEIPTCCLSVKRSALREHGPFRPKGYCSDTAFNWRLARAGQPPRLDPAISVAHCWRPTLRSFAAKQLMHGRAFARMRVAEQALSPPRRLAYLAGSPLLPALLGARLARGVLLEKRRYRARLLAAAPFVVLGLCLWSLGEAIGYARPD